ncbi:MAG: HD domain-containing protein [Epsilonproteobacteria bacterium]|nr:HD domain-containing protein [Campylobacterota bacterium]
MNLDIKIENLISENRSDFEVSKCIKDEIRSYIDSLDVIFDKDQGKSFLVKHTKSIDGYIKVIFKYALRKHFGEFLPLINTLPITIISLGSYAREQLCVYSDIDLMIVYKEVDGYHLKPIIETILQIAWDSGLRLGHRVHEIEDLHPASLQDQTIKTALLESRYLCGSKHLWMHTERELSIIRKDNQKTYIQEKINERTARLKKYPFNMQPNIKSSAGGLRDLNTLFWIAKTLYNVSKIKDLSPDMISEQEYSRLMTSIEFLFRVRVALHLSAGKKQDQLLLEYIPDIATKFQMTQRKLVERTFEAMLNIEVICEYMIRKITHAILFEQKNLTTLRANRHTKNIYITAQSVCSPLQTDSKDLNFFVETFLTMPDQKRYFEITYVNYLKQAHKSEINLTQMKTLFYRKYLYNFFIALYKAKKIDTLIPPLKKIAHLPQFDGYHKYPVDIHSIRTLLALEEISDPNVLALYESFDEEEKALLRLVTFLHDCGKGRRKDHSELGATIVKHYVKELGFSDKHIEYTSTLVRYHTMMSNIASREDIYSEKVVFAFISKLKEPKVLKLLFVLTYADIESVGKGTYSNFNARLLNELFEIASEAFDHKDMITEAQKRAKKEKIIKNDKSFLKTSKLLQKKILSIESNLLLFKYTPFEIVRIATWVYELNQPYDYRITNDKILTIEIIRSDALNLGYLLAKLSTLSVGTMDIFKFFNNIKYFRVEFLEPVEQEDILHITEIIDHSFDMTKKVKLSAVNILKKEVKIDCNHSKTYAIMQINTKDQSSLLANIMSTFDDIGIDIASAKIQTIKNRARNLFLIEKNGKFCINQDQIVERLTKQ